MKWLRIVSYGCGVVGSGGTIMKVFLELLKKILASEFTTWRNWLQSRI
jgi:hypothetical protein